MTLFKFEYKSRKLDTLIMNAIVSYDSKKYNDKYPMFKVVNIYERTDPYLEKVSIGDHFIYVDTDNKDINKEINNINVKEIKISIYEWESSVDKKHYYFDIYHNYSIENPNVTLVRI